ncbi:translocation/assembly module TamB domain-containing protein [Leptothoe spongobia]|uniref:Translocation/assembly module TamB domain-containing protein n=1 Tax=Leptothoe spongobia TAU-MAC 1115 TaxID=1967444 RepID=A0A947GIP4_9CYAN|nr:translocation/assembly module TamB domain-containing protein [Leptothoe spongobia]MBT9315849.1 translocation/assembly module TamB domain-containing protein [Leptothoe spongobia TAU-MAC 1115]
MPSPNADRPPEGRRFWKIAAITLGAGTLIVGTAAFIGAWLFINKGLTPLLERRLSILLERELELGELEGLSWNSLRVGSSRLNATDTDPSYATAESVEVGFNPLQVLFDRELDIDLRLVGAAGYIEQHPEEGWIGIDVPTFEPPPEEPLIKVRMDDIEVVDSQITLVPLPADGAALAPLLLTDLNGAVGIDPVEVNGQDSQRIEFDAIATPPKGGNLEFTGAVVPVASGNRERPIQQETRLGIGGEGVAAEAVMAFLLPTLGQQNLPIAATAGRVSGHWTISFLPEQPITVDGAGSVDNGQLQIASLPSTGQWGNTIDDIDITARFKGTTITVDSAKGSYSELVAATATGTVDWNGDYDLTAQVTEVDLEQILAKSEVDSPLTLSGVFDGNVAITGPILQPELAANVVATRPVIVDRVVLNEVNAEVVLASERLENLLDTITVTQVSAAPELGGQVTGRGVLNLAQLAEGGPPDLNFQAEATNVSGDAIAALYDVEQLPVTLGIVDATATIIGPPDTLQTRINVQSTTLAYGGQVYPTTATAVFANGGLSIPQALVQVGAGTLTGNGKVERDSWQANIAASNIDLQALGLAQLPPGNFNADVALAGPIQAASLTNLLAVGNYSLQLANGSIQGDAELINGNWRTDANINALGLSQFASQLRGDTSGRVSLTGRIDALTLAALRGQGDLTFSSGLAGFSPQLAGFDAPLNSRFAWTGQELLIEEASSDQLFARGVVSPQLVGNQFQGIRGFALDLDAKRYPLALLPSPVPVDGFASFNGRLVGTPNDPRLDGTLLLEQFGVNQVAFDPVLLGPVSYQSQAGLTVDLDGQSGPVAGGLTDGIAINFQTPRNLDFDVSWQGAQASGRTEGDVLRATLQNLPLQALGLPGVNRLGGGLKGTLSSQGEWVVDLNRQTLVGNVFIAQPGLGYINAQQLTGQIAYRDRRVFVEQGELIFNTCSQRLVTESPLPTYCAAGDVADSIYRFNGNMRLDTLAYNANVVVENGDIKDVLTALAITDFEDLIQTFQAPTWLENPPPSDAIPGILATQSAGNSEAALLEQVRRLAEIQEIQAQVALAEAKNPIPPLDLLEGRFNATVSVSGAPQQLPEIRFDLDGDNWMWGQEFVADRVIAIGQLANGNLTLQPVRMETALPPDAEGNQQLAFVNLAGNLSLVEQDSSGLQLVAEQLPMGAVRDIFNLPLGLDGRLNAIANFSGGLDNPTVRGDIILADGRINDQPIAQAEGLFLYEDARLLLLGELLQVDNTQPLTLVGDIPYAFDFMTVKPADDRIALSLDVADDGLALLNVLNNQVSWESGTGQVSLDIGGTLRQPTISGVMDVRDTVLRSPLLPDPLTDFAGRVVFEGNQIIVKELQGQYGNGRLQAAGAVPLGFPPIITNFELAALGADPEPLGEGETVNDENVSDDTGPIPSNPDAINGVAPIAPVHPTGALTVTLDDIDLDLRGIYRGGVNGQVVVGGSLNPLLGGPQLGGVVELANGRLFLPEGGNTSTSAEPEEIPLFVPRFENLKITLAKNIQIQQSNLLNVVAQGDLRISGPLRPFRAIQPEGTIRLRSGRINLLTTTFRLAGRNNIAQFFPERGIADPFLDLRLRTSVAETQQSNVVEATAFANSEVDDTSLDPFQGTAGIETIRIRATYQGSASNLLESLFISDSSDTVIELSSSPPRSRREIINLLSGSYVAALQSGQGVLNFFGGALLNSLQDFISTTLNLSEFRLFPVTGASRFSNEDNSGSTLDVATEIGFDVTDNITLSLVKILTDSTPTEFNLRYRLTDEFTIRGTTNFDDRNRVLLEFETRF